MQPLTPTSCLLVVMNLINGSLKCPKISTVNDSLILKMFIGNYEKVQSHYIKVYSLNNKKDI